MGEGLFLNHTFGFSLAYSYLCSSNDDKMEQNNELRTAWDFVEVRDAAYF